MRVRWTAEARSDLVRIHRFLAPVNRRAAAAALRRLRAGPVRLLYANPRLGTRLPVYESREIRRLIVDDYDLRYEIRAATILIVRVWHVREDR